MQNSILVQIAQYVVSFVLIQLFPLVIVALFWAITLGGFDFTETVHSNGFLGANVCFALCINSIASGCVVDEANKA